MGGKKPGPKLLGIFRKPSGLEAAYEAIDKAIAAYEKCQKLGDLEKLHKKVADALAAARTKDQTYFHSIQTQMDAEIATGEEQGGKYDGPLSTLVNASTNLMQSVQKRLRDNEP